MIGCLLVTTYLWNLRPPLFAEKLLLQTPQKTSLLVACFSENQCFLISLEMYFDFKIIFYFDNCRFFWVNCNSGVYRPLWDNLKIKFSIRMSKNYNYRYFNKLIIDDTFQNRQKDTNKKNVIGNNTNRAKNVFYTPVSIC